MVRTGQRRMAGLLSAGAILAVVVGCQPVSSAAPPNPQSTGLSATANTGTTTGPAGTGVLAPTTVPAMSVTLEPLASVTGGPLAIAAPEDGTGRLFVASQDGRIWVVRTDGSVPSDPMVDLSSRIKSGGEQGLLGLALHPGFPDDPRVYVDYTNTDGDTVVASLTLDPGDPNRLDPGSLQQLLFVHQPFANHNGGALAFGPDEDLYVSLGDGGSGGDPQGNGQNTQALLAKILRLDVDGAAGGQAYAIPAGNPFANGGGAPEAWLYGLRNPWRMSFDRATGDLWIGDVGQGSYEEVDVAREGIGGLNFGWNRMEATHCYATRVCPSDGLTLPVAEYGRDIGSTVIGGYVYRGAKYPVAVGTYVFADYGSGGIFAIGSGVTQLVAPVTVGTGPSGRISAFGEGVDGELYVTALDGTVSRVVFAGK